MSWLWAIIFLSFTFSDKFITEAKHQKKLPSAVIVGTVYCDTCFQQDFSKANHFLSGASVAVECKDNRSSPASNFRKEVKTNKHGEFQVHLPLPISKHINKIKSCSVKLIRSNEPLCAIAATATSSNLRLKSRKQGTHVFSAGFFTFKPLNHPEVCDQKPVVKNSRKPEKLSPIDNPNDPTFYSPLQDPKPDPPTLGGIFPLPELPRLPPIPLLTPDAKKEQTLEDSKVNPATTFQFLPPNPFNPLPPNPLNPPLLPPNPLLPPPSILPPNPFLPPPSLIPPIMPSPPPSLFPPILPTPPSPPSLPIPLPPLPALPPIPGLSPPPLPPAPPTFPIPFPPFPFLPTPGLPGPGVPPAVRSSESKTSSP